MRIPPAPVRLDGRQRRERFPIARPRSRGSPALHCDAGPKQRNTTGNQELPGVNLADVGRGRFRGDPSGRRQLGVHAILRRRSSPERLA